MKTLRSLFLNELADMYDSERRIALAWPKFIEAATSGRVRRALRYHLDDSETHAKKLERIFASFGETPKIKECSTMANILNEGAGIILANEGSSGADQAILAVCQKVEHYEVALYTTLRACAKSLGNAEAAALIEEILAQEKEAAQTMFELESWTNEDHLQPVGAVA